MEKTSKKIIVRKRERTRRGDYGQGMLKKGQQKRAKTTVGESTAWQNLGLKQQLRRMCPKAPNLGAGN